jgi:hypothetical protein
MITTVGKFEVRCIAFGTSGGKWTGQWSVHLIGAGERSQVAAGVTDPMDNAVDAEREGDREGTQRAKELDEGVGEVTPYSDFD